VNGARARFKMATKNTCSVYEAATHVDTCACKAYEGQKCNLPDSTCRQRAVVAGSGPATVEKAHAYDSRLATEAKKKQNELLAKCKVKRRSCPHKTVPVPLAPDAELDNNGQTPSGEGSRSDCEIAQQVRDIQVIIDKTVIIIIIITFICSTNTIEQQQSIPC